MAPCCAGVSVARWPGPLERVMWGEGEGADGVMLTRTLAARDGVMEPRSQSEET